MNFNPYSKKVYCPVYNREETIWIYSLPEQYHNKTKLCNGCENMSDNPKCNECLSRNTFIDETDII